MTTAIVILNWNGKKLLETFLPSVVAHTQNANIYLADNASTDDSVNYVKRSFPTIKIIQNKTNEGYAKGYNLALKTIEADVFCLLNSDIEVTKNWLEPIVKAFKKDTETAIIQPKLLDYKNKDYFEYAGAAGGFIDKFGYPYCRGRIFNTIEKDYGQYNDIANIFWASGACFFIRKHVFESLKGFDERFFAHMEEIDLCWRAKNQGYKVKYVPDAVVYHVGGATLSHQNPQKTYLNFRNSLYLLTKNAKQPLFPIIFIRLSLDGIAAIKFLFELKPRHTFSILKAHFSYYNYLRIFLKERKVQKHKINYYTKKSLVIDYFINKKTKYSSL